MPTLAAIALALIAAAITPGPNNFIVMRAASAQLRDALPAIGGILIGSLLVLAIAGLGLGTAFASMPRLRDLAAIAGAAYLAWLGLRLILPRTAGGPESGLPRHWAALIAFQLANPKGWIMMLTLVAALPADAAHSHWVRLIPLVIAIPGLCLLLWALFGRALGRLLQNERARRAVDRVFGLLLIVSAGSLLPF